MAFSSIVNLPDPYAPITTGIGTGLAGVLEGLAQDRIQRLRQGRTAQGLEALGFSPKQAKQISMLDPNIVSQLAQAKLQEPYLQAMGESLGLDYGQQEQPATQNLQNMLSGLSPEDTQTLRESLVISPGAAQEQIVEQQQLPVMKAEPLLKPVLKPEQALKVAEFQEKKRARESKEVSEHYKLTKPELDEIKKRSKVAKEDLRSLDRLEELEDSGKLDSASYYTFLKNAGLDIPALMSPESQEYNKIVNNFVRNIKDIFGAKISNQEMEQFMKTLPNLSQSAEGRKRVIANLKNIARVNAEYGNTLKEVMAKYNNRVPIGVDVAAEVEDKMEKKLDKFTAMFKKDLAKKTPPAESGLAIGSAAALGKATPVVGGAALGAAIGSIFPGPGTAVGAGIGALGGFGKSFINSVFSS